MSHLSLEHLVEALLLAALLWPLLRLAATPGFLRRLGALPAVFLGLAVGLVGYVGGIVVVAVYAPALLRPLALLAAAFVAVERWRARPAYGRRRGLPPGSLAILPVAPLRDHLFFRRQAERYGPIFKSSQFLRPVVCVVGLARAIDLLSRHDAILQPPSIPFNTLVPGSFIRYMSLEDHEIYAPILRAAFTRDVIADCEAYVAACVRYELGRMAADSAASSAAGVRPHPYLRRLVRISFARLFFGLTPEAGALERLLALGEYLDFRNLARSRRGRSRRALAEIAAIIRAEAARPAAAAGAGAVTSFLDALVRAHPTSIEDPTVVCNLAYLMEDTANDVTGLLDWLFRHLTDHRRWVEPLRAEVGHGGGPPPDGLASRIVLETLRLEQMEFVYRNVTQDMPLDGFVVPKGWLLRICVRDSHRDPAVFPDPDTFDPDRFRDRSYTRAQFAPFGSLGSRRVCLGEHLSKMVGRVFVSELAAGFDWSVVRDGPREFSGWHWAPSRRLRVHLTPRT